jgi:NAD-dependent SIR2 family protein deacetylase
MNITQLKTYIQSANINFLLGSGLSKPYLDTLGDIEKWLTELANQTIYDNVQKIIEASIYRAYFTKVILPNYNPDKSNTDYKSVIENYKNFLTVWNDIFNKRANKLLSKQLNIYTTNIDTLVEQAVEQTKIEFNNGFKGTIQQVFDEGNFQKSYSKTSLHYQNTFEIPVFNLLKMHGSINWQESNNEICNDYLLNQVKSIDETLKKIDDKLFVECGEFSEMLTNADTLAKDAENSSVDFSTIYNPFIESYKQLIIVNPTKQKFSETVMDLHFYELMRMFSNSLEKENSVLFVMGFSFADEHIREITLRAANTNPTLLVVVFSYKDETDNPDFENFNKLKGTNNNILIVTPQNFKESNPVDEKETNKKKIIDSITNFDLSTINKAFLLINNEIPANYGK